MARTSHVDHVEIESSSHPVQMRVHEVETRRRSPMAQEPRFHMRRRQRFLEQRIVEQIDLPDRQIVRGSPIGVDPLELIVRQRRAYRYSHRNPVRSAITLILRLREHLDVHRRGSRPGIWCPTFWVLWSAIEPTSASGRPDSPVQDLLGSGSCMISAMRTSVFSLSSSRIAR